MAAFKERLEIAGLVAEVTAAIGVIISVIYLAVQVSHNTEALYSQTHFNLLDMSQDALVVAMSNPELNSIVVRGRDDPANLDEEEWNRFLNSQLLEINSWEYAYYLNEDGTIPPQVWEGYNAYYIGFARNEPGVKRFWEEFGFAYAEPFHSYADQYFAEELPENE